MLLSFIESAFSKIGALMLIVHWKQVNAARGEDAEAIPFVT
jgi:hypothetical protein